MVLPKSSRFLYRIIKSKWMNIASLKRTMLFVSRQTPLFILTSNTSQIDCCLSFARIRDVVSVSFSIAFFNSHFDEFKTNEYLFGIKISTVFVCYQWFHYGVGEMFQLLIKLNTVYSFNFRSKWTKRRTSCRNECLHKSFSITTLSYHIQRRIVGGKNSFDVLKKSRKWHECLAWCVSVGVCMRLRACEHTTTARFGCIIPVAWLKCVILLHIIIENDYVFDHISRNVAIS